MGVLTSVFNPELALCYHSCHCRESGLPYSGYEKLSVLCGPPFSGPHLCCLSDPSICGNLSHTKPQDWPVLSYDHCVQSGHVSRLCIIPSLQLYYVYVHARPHSLLGLATSEDCARNYVVWPRCDCRLAFCRCFDRSTSAHRGSGRLYLGVPGDGRLWYL